MIYNDLSLAKDDLKWILQSPTIISDETNLLNKKRVEQYINQFDSINNEYIKNFYSELFINLGFEKLVFKNEFDKESLPVIGFLENIGMVLIYEQLSDGSFKVQTKLGKEIFFNFPENSFFSVINKKKIENKITAVEMFKNIAYEQKRLLIYAGIATFTINTLALGTSLYTMQVYDRVVPTGAMSTLVALSIGVFIAMFLELMIKFSKSILLDYATKQMDIEYSNNIFRRFLQIRCDSLPKSIGTLSGQLQSYNSVRSFITSAALYIFIDVPFSLIFVLAIFIIGGLKIGMIPILFFLLSLFVGFFFRKKIEQASLNSSMASHKKMGLMVEAVENSENIKATGAGFGILNNWNKLTQEAINDDIVIRHYSDKSNYITAFLQQLSYISIVSIGAYLVSEEGELTMGALIAMTILSGRVLQPIAQLPNHFVQWGKTKLAINDLNNIYNLDRDNENIDRPLTPFLDTVDLKCQDVKFGYTDQSNAISIANLEIKEGEKVAILGAIGSGKTTLLKMLAGLYKPKSGSIFLNGIDMQFIKRDFLTEVINYLPQNNKLFSGTLRDNLIFGMIGVNDYEVIEAAKLTGLITLINALPNGLDTVVPEGGESVSGGQKQLIALTRMLISDKKLLLLDEPTASLDEGTEKRIISMLKGKITDKQTLIVVTHKPIVLNLVDRIVLVSANGIIMDGNKDEVLKKLSAPKIIAKENI